MQTRKPLNRASTSGPNQRLKPPGHALKHCHLSAVVETDLRAVDGHRIGGKPAVTDGISPRHDLGRLALPEILVEHDATRLQRGHFAGCQCTEERARLNRCELIAIAREHQPGTRRQILD